MKTKSVLVAYCYLFVFVFVFAIGFTMASKAQAGTDEYECCVVAMCPPPYDDEVFKEGHWVPLPKGGRECRQEDNHWCDWTYLCPGP
ncbi:MAG: hypothetical protein AB1772_11330 [Candidatus Zixiibacteriota bacterium]